MSSGSLSSKLLVEVVEQVVTVVAWIVGAGEWRGRVVVVWFAKSGV